MEGANRPGHFDGVATIVEKLYESIPATRAYFGEKDYQQLLIIRSLVRQKNIDIEIGPQFAYLLTAKNIINGKEFQTNYGDESASIDLKDSLRDFDLGVTGGVGYVFDTGFYLNARYNIGVLNTYQKRENFNDIMRNGTIQFSVGYSLNY
jgi:hypothetical protein